MEIVVEALTGAAEVVAPPEQIKLKQHPAIREPNIRTYRLETGRGVKCISDGGAPPFSVPNRPPALGKMSSLPSNNET